MREAKEKSLPVLVHGVQAKISPLADKLKNLPAGGCTPDVISPIIVQDMKDILIDTNAQLQLYIDANVDLSVLLADAAHSDITVSVETFASILLTFSLHVVVSACLSVLKLAVNVELDLVVKILEDSCITPGVFIHLCLTLDIGFSTSLMAQISAFIPLCVQLGASVTLNAILGVGVSL
uniref:Uncharacterized protein n=1 Tax=Moniliophthora roreri TaxID=221103 RepID=A0A0W0FPE9_MONRR